MGQALKSVFVSGSQARIGYYTASGGPINALTAWPVSMAQWIKADTVAICRGMGVTDASGFGNGTYRFKFYTSINSGNLRVTMEMVSSEGVSYVQYDIPSYSSAAWHHICIVISSNTSQKLYIDGTLQTTGTNTRSFAGYDSITIAPAGNTDPTIEGFCALYDYELSEAQVIEIMHKPTSLPCNWLLSGVQTNYSATASDYIDLGPYGADCNIIQGTTSYYQDAEDGPPVFF